MLFTQSVFIGVQPSARPAVFNLAVLDPELNVLALSAGDVKAVVAHATAQSATTVAINAAARSHLVGVKKNPEQPGLPPQAGAPDGLRAAQHGSPLRLRSAFHLRRSLLQLGFVSYPGGPAAHQVLEADPLVTFNALLGAVPLARQSMQGRLQRALVLYERGLRIPDPMSFFEEITRHRLLLGQWPVSLPSADELDALSAAYTAVLAAIQPDRLTWIGDARGGRIAVPVPDQRAKN
jgi:hypothetical protein